MKITANNLVHAIKGLPKDTWFNYVSSKTKSQVKFVSATSAQGPVTIERRNAKGEVSKQSISSDMLTRVANAITPNVPISLDRVLGASYNTRSALEALLAHTPEFYWCMPGRIQVTNNSTKIEPGHKHLIWTPDKPHNNGVICESQLGSGFEISELPTQNVIYEALSITGSPALNQEPLPIDVKRRHLQIQIALIEIGRQLGFRTWVAHNDKGFQYGQKRIGELDGVIAKLQDERVLSAYDEAITAANLIDCIWFKNGKLMPAVLEVEHSTGVTSGLTRMKRFQDAGPALKDVRWVIVAADEDRENVIKKASDPQFASLNTRFFPYSAVEELHNLSLRRGLSNRSVNEAFLDCFMEPCLPQESFH